MKPTYTFIPLLNGPHFTDRSSLLRNGTFPNVYSIVHETEIVLITAVNGPYFTDRLAINCRHVITALKWSTSHKRSINTFIHFCDTSQRTYIFTIAYLQINLISPSSCSVSVTFYVHLI